MAEAKSLQQRMAEKQIAKTVWDTDKKNWVYLTIPEENALGEKHASLASNNHNFEPGQTYLVPPEVGADMKERLSTYNRACVRVLQPKRDYKAEQAVQIGSGSSGGSPVDPSSF